MAGTARFIQWTAPIVIALAAAPAGAEARADQDRAAATERAPWGPKRTIAVGGIEAAGGYSLAEQWDAGNALSSMLAEELEQSDRFILVERTSLDDVLNEQQLAASKVTQPVIAGTPRMIAAQYLVVGSVVEFGAPKKGGGLSVGGLGLGRGTRGGAALNRQSGKVRIALRLLNARTGQVVDSFTVSAKASRTGVALTGNRNGVSAGANAFAATPLGEASRKAIAEAVGKISAALAASNWEGRVVGWDGTSLIVNTGSDGGLSVGDRLRVERQAQVLTDPETGLVLSESRNTLGEVVIASTEPRIARGQFYPAGGGVVPERGDLVVYLPEGR